MQTTYRTVLLCPLVGAVAVSLSRFLCFFGLPCFLRGVLVCVEQGTTSSSESVEITLVSHFKCFPGGEDTALSPSDFLL